MGSTFIVFAFGLRLGTQVAPQHCPILRSPTSSIGCILLLCSASLRGFQLFLAMRQLRKSSALRQHAGRIVVARHASRELALQRHGVLTQFRRLIPDELRLKRPWPKVVGYLKRNGASLVQAHLEKGKSRLRGVR